MSRFPLPSPSYVTPPQSELFQEQWRLLHSSSAYEPAPTSVCEDPGPSGQIWAADVLRLWCSCRFIFLFACIHLASVQIIQHAIEYIPLAEMASAPALNGLHSNIPNPCASTGRVCLQAFGKFVASPNICAVLVLTKVPRYRTV